MKQKKVRKSPIHCSPQELVASRFRQIHLDFHTSEHIPDVGREFDADAFAERLVEARVNWITVFAKCHHGLSYYPTRAGTVHPALRRDLLGEQVEACRKRGIVTPAYISVRVDEHHAKVNPDWIARTKDNKSWKWGETLGAGWYNHCLNNRPYVDELEAQAIEVLKAYDVEGLFFDMCYYAQDPGCYCPRCYDSMKKLGMDFASDEDHRRHEYLITRDYTKRLARAVRSVRRNATLFFNGRVSPGVEGELDILTHLEIEALPTGGWGYAYYPIHARYARVHPRPVQGMTGRFHKAWADFGGLKTADMLQYEAGTILAAGGVMNVGDQLHPRGTLDKGAYQVIGEVFRHVEKCEPWCLGAVPTADIGVMMLPESKEKAYDERGRLTTRNITLSSSADGAGRMLLELKHQFNLIYPTTKLDRYRAVVLPDRGFLPPETARALGAFVKKGGGLLVSHKAGLESGMFAVPGLPVTFQQDNPFKPCYMELGHKLGAGLPESAFVCYEDSARVELTKGARHLGNLVDSYFNRAYDHFCSHNQTPPDKTTPYPVAAIKGRVAYLAPAIFHAYREHAYPVYKRMVSHMLDEILPEPLVRATAPSAMEISLHRQPKEKRLVLHLVNFQPQRRHTHVEWIEELFPVRDIGVAVRTVRPPTAIHTAPHRQPLQFVMNGSYCEIAVPEVKAHQMVVLEGV